jgi:hypothetical protein
MRSKSTGSTVNVLSERNIMYKITLVFTEPLLGTAPMDKEVYSTYIADNRPANGMGEFPSDEVATLNEEKGKTGFHRLEDGTPILYDYVLKGFFKDACGMLSRVDGSESKKLKAYKKIIDGLVFVYPRQIPIVLSGSISELQRPLRAQTAQGERVALACSEMVPAGSSISFELDVLEDKVLTPALLKEWFSYGGKRGLGQWRNGSYGRFDGTIESV